MALQNGSILNERYRILSILGQGGFGAVYRAADMTLKRPCAVKENLDTTPEAQRQFEKEAIVLAQLSHPNLPRVQDHFVIPGQGQYLVMDFVEGADLQTIVAQSGRVDPETALDWIGQIASALAYLHDQKPPVIHRDIKPANIRVTEEGRAFLVDFGLVKIYDPHLRTTVGARAVTPGYSPPEQYGQGNTDRRTDIYALGATLYTLLTGLEPQESVQRVVEDHLIPLGAANTRVQETVSKAVGVAMDLRPSGRYKTIQEFQKALKTSASPPAHEAATVQIERQDMTVQVASAKPAPAPVEMSVESPAAIPTAAPDYGRQVKAAKKPIWKQPWLYIGVVVAFAICAGLGYGGYLMLKPEDSGDDTSEVSSTPDTQATRTAQARKNQTQQAIDAAALTESASKPSDTPWPTDTATDVPTFTLVPSNTPTLDHTDTPVPTDTPLPSATNTSAPPSTYFMIDNWCLTHQGCATIDVRNNSGMVSNWHLTNSDFGVDASFTVYPGPAVIETRPGKYQFYVTYCGGEVADFAWQLNNNWYYKISPCD